MGPVKPPATTSLTDVPGGQCFTHTSQPAAGEFRMSPATPFLTSVPGFPWLLPHVPLPFVDCDSYPVAVRNRSLHNSALSPGSPSGLPKWRLVLGTSSPEMVVLTFSRKVLALPY